MYYKIKNGSVTLSGNTILENICFTVADNEKIGIVGRNGTGKTTLLKAITNEIELEDGYDLLEVEKTDFKIGYSRQNIDYSDDELMIDFILESYKDILEVEAKIEKLSEKISTKYNAHDLDLYNDLFIKYEYMGGNTYKKEYEIALKKFGFSDSDKNKKMKEFSLGQVTKLSLIRLLLSKPDLLILDECDYIGSNQVTNILNIRNEAPERIRLICASTPSGKHEEYYRWCTGASKKYFPTQDDIKNNRFTGYMTEEKAVGEGNGWTEIYAPSNVNK